MRHSFIASQLDTSLCGMCKRSITDHKNEATCESCDFIGECDLLGTMLLCASCLKKEYDIAVAQTKEHAEHFELARINTAITNPIGSILKSIELDSALAVREDFFNAEIISIQELKLACNNANLGPFELASLIDKRFKLFKKVLFEMEGARLNLHSRQKADFIALNELASQLSEKEREELKLKDLSYIPVQPKAPPKPRLTIDERMAQNLVNVKLRKAAQELVDNQTCADIDEGMKVAKARGLGISIEKARVLIQHTLGK